MMLQTRRIIRAGLRNFTRNLWLSTAATAVMTVTLTLVITAFISSLALNQTVKGVTDKIDVSIYLNDTTTKDQAVVLEQRLASDSNVASSKYISKDSALSTYIAANPNDKAFRQAVAITGNPLPASIQVRAKDPKNLDSIIAITSSTQYKGLLDPTAPPSYSGNNKTTIDRIVSVSNFIKSFGLIASIIFIIISILIIFNTIRMAIFTRRDEIEIMKLVGATKWFIRGPFLFEAALYGIVAALIAVGLSYGLLLGGGPKLSNYIDVTTTIMLFQSNPVLIIGGELLIGIFIGTFSSLLAMSRYLKL
jgi:cell division transport system permease protein